MTKELDEKTITIGQLKAMALLMTYVVRSKNLSKEWTRGIDDLVDRVIDYVKVCL